VPWMNIGGWAGIQQVTVEGDAVTFISTVVAGGDCTDGAMCGYACPAGWQMAQWPSQQGSTGQSVGGVSCQGGKLYKTNSAYDTLCIQGTGTVYVQSELSESVAVCRTLYPGTEDETVPLNVEPGVTNPLTCPDASTYYKHEGSGTSAQYYVNMQGIAVSEACQWDNDGSNMGNFAPVYFGVGKDESGLTWLAMSTTAQNGESGYENLNYTVTITGSGLSSECRLQNGNYCTGSDFSDCNTVGCTVELLSGTATYVLSD